MPIIPRAFIVTFILLLLCSRTEAQEFYFGAKGGANVVKIGGLDVTNHFKPGFHIGLFSTFRPYRMDISITNEILFAMKGVSVILPDSFLMDGGNKYVRSFNYIDLPVILNYHFNDNFYVSAGMQASLYAYFGSPSWHEIPYNKDNVNIIDFSVLVGSTLTLDEYWGFGIRYNHSFVPTFQTKEGRCHLLQVFFTYKISRRR